VEQPLPTTVLRQDELASINAISTMDLSPAFLIELKKAMTTRRSSITTPGEGTIAFHLSSVQLGGKRLADELACSCDSSEPAIGAKPQALGPQHCPRL